MGTAVRLASLVGIGLVLGLKPTEVRSLSVSPIDHLSDGWALADQVPCRMYLYTINGCECVTVLEEIHISNVAND